MSLRRFACIVLYLYFASSVVLPMEERGVNRLDEDVLRHARVAINFSLLVPIDKREDEKKVIDGFCEYTELEVPIGWSWYFEISKLSYLRWDDSLEELLLVHGWRRYIPTNDFQRFLINVVLTRSRIDLSGASGDKVLQKLVKQYEETLIRRHWQVKRLEMLLVGAKLNNNWFSIKPSLIDVIEKSENLLEKDKDCFLELLKKHKEQADIARRDDDSARGDKKERIAFLTKQGDNFVIKLGFGDKEICEMCACKLFFRS